MRRGETASSATASEEKRRLRESREEEEEEDDERVEKVEVVDVVVADGASTIPEIERPLQSRDAPQPALPKVLLDPGVAPRERRAREDKRRASIVRFFSLLLFKPMLSLRSESCSSTSSRPSKNTSEERSS